MVGITALVAGDGSVAEKYTYDAFANPTITDWNGNVRSQSNRGNRFMFQGREYIAGRSHPEEAAERGMVETAE